MLKRRDGQSATAVEREVPGGGRGSVKDGPVQEVNGGLGVNHLEDLAEEQAQLFSCSLGTDSKLHINTTTGNASTTLFSV